ncbi:MAG: phosphatidate cytidylyltransferase, partial [Sphingomicrobium sp.]
MSDLLVRTLTGLVLIAAALIAAVAGGYVLAVLVAASATAIFYEWTRLNKGRGAAWYVAGLFYAALPALALLWVRERSGLDLLLWL